MVRGVASGLVALNMKPCIATGMDVWEGREEVSGKASEVLSK